MAGAVYAAFSQFGVYAGTAVLRLCSRSNRACIAEGGAEPPSVGLGSPKLKIFELVSVSGCPLPVVGIGFFYRLHQARDRGNEQIGLVDATLEVFTGDVLRSTVCKRAPSVESALS